MNTLKLPKRNSIRGWSKMLTGCFMLVLLFCAFFAAQAQYPPSHDPTKVVRNSDGRYWIFTTGSGVWAMSSSNANFTNWRAESTPFAPGTWPSWINNYVPGFSGDFWAPGIIQMNGYYYLYYSASTFGSSTSAIGVTRASNLNGPWTDLGVVVSSNGNNDINAIDPALFRDTNGDVWMTYGSWFGGIGVVRINSSTGKTTGSVTHIAGGNHQDREAPYIIKNGSFYYLFSNRGSCCNGLSSTYYIVVARSTSITGPYSGERTFISNQNGNVVGPGHFGYGEGRLTYHFYDGNDNGNAKLMVRSDFGFADGWPYLGSPPSSGGGSVVQLRNRGTGLYLDGMGRTGNGDACGQWGNTTHPNSQWERIDVGSGYYQLRNVGTGLYLDGMGRTSNGSDVGQWANTTHYNSHWTMPQYSGSYYQLRNRGTGLYLDGMGRTANGSACGQWANTTHVNSQWELISVSGARLADTEEELQSMSITFYPNPVNDVLNVRLEDNTESMTARIVNLSGQLMLEEGLIALDNKIDVRDLSNGVYFLELITASGSRRMKLIKQ